jgi:hypothetical protein
MTKTEPAAHLPYLALGQGLLIFCLQAVTLVAAGRILYATRRQPAKLCVTTMSTSMTIFITSMAIGAVLGMP